MSTYTILLFLHVVGDIGLFFGVGIQLLSLTALRQVKQIDQVYVIARLIAIADSIGVISALLTIATGLYMARTAWSLRTGWIAVALASIILILSPIIGLVIGPRMRAIVSATKGEQDDPISDTLYSKIYDPVLGTALKTMAVLLVGIVFLMTNKPSLSGAILTIAIALVTGLVSGMPLWWGRGGRMKSRSDGAL